jgi:hypothetical protein
MLKRTTGIMIYMYRLARGGHVFGGIMTKMESVLRTSQRSFLQSFVLIGIVVSDEEKFRPVISNRYNLLEIKLPKIFPLL